MTNTTDKVIGTTTSGVSVQYKKHESCLSTPKKDVDTKGIIHSKTPGVYRRRITVISGKSPSSLPVVYNHKHVQRELAFIKANRALEEQRNG